MGASLWPCHVGNNSFHWITEVKQHLTWAAHCRSCSKVAVHCSFSVLTTSCFALSYWSQKFLIHLASKMKQKVISALRDQKTAEQLFLRKRELEPRSDFFAEILWRVDRSNCGVRLDVGSANEGNRLGWGNNWKWKGRVIWEVRQGNIFAETIELHRPERLLTLKSTSWILFVGYGVPYLGMILRNESWI